MRHANLRGLIVFLTLSLSLIMAACGGSSTKVASGGGNGGNTPAATATTDSGGGNPTATPSSGGGSNPTATPSSGGGSNPTATPAPSCADGSSALFVHTATAASIHTTADNSYTASTYIDNCYTNGHPNLVLTVTPNWSYHGNGVYDTRPIGVWYDNVVGKWAIFNQDESTMPTNATFNVLASPADSSHFVVTTSASNVAGDYVKTSIQDESFILIVTQNYEPNLRLNNHNIGVWYDGTEWSIYNEDKAAMATNGVSFNVVALPHNANFDFIHVTAPGTNSGDYSIFSNPLTDGQPNKLVFVTHNWGDSAGYMIYNNAPLGVWYTNGHWSVFNETQGSMQTYMSVNVLVQG